MTFLEFKPRRALRPSFKPVISLSLLCCHWFVNKRVPNEKKGKGTDVGMCIACHLHEGCGFSQVWGKGERCGAVCLLLVDCACPSKEAQHFGEERRKMGPPPLFTLCAAVFFTDAMPFGRGRCTSVCARASSFSSLSLFLSSFPPPTSSARMCFPVHRTPGFYILVLVLIFLLVAPAVLFEVYLVNFFFVYIGNTA